MDGRAGLARCAVMAAGEYPKGDVCVCAGETAGAGKDKR